MARSEPYSPTAAGQPNPAEPNNINQDLLSKSSREEQLVTLKSTSTKQHSRKHASDLNGHSDSFTTNDKCLIIVDVQHDFLPKLEGHAEHSENDGSLAVQDANQVIGIICDMLDKNEWKFVVASKDYHPKDHVSFASQHEGMIPFESTIDAKDKEGNAIVQRLWPDHCVQGSHGSEVEKSIRERIEKLAKEGKAMFVHKGTRKEVDAYSAFENDCKQEEPLDHILKQKNISEVVVVGLATDYCVKATAIDAAKYGYNTTVQTNAIRAVGGKEATIATIDNFKEHGVQVT